MNRRTLLQSIIALIAAPLAFIRWHWGAWRHGTTSITVDHDLSLEAGDRLLFDHPPLPGDYNGCEIMTVERVDGNLVTVMRPTCGTFIRAHPTGATARVFRGGNHNGPIELEDHGVTLTVMVSSHNHPHWYGRDTIIAIRS